jgi:hypothetical protein
MAEERVEPSPLDQPLTRRDMLAVLDSIAFYWQHWRDIGPAMTSAAKCLEETWSRKPEPEPPQKTRFPRGVEYREGDRAPLVSDDGGRY